MSDVLPSTAENRIYHFLLFRTNIQNPGMALILTLILPYAQELYGKPKAAYVPHTCSLSKEDVYQVCKGKDGSATEM